MNVVEFAAQLRCILNDYENSGRQPQRVLEIIACKVREFSGCHRALHGTIETIRRAVNVWERGDRPDLDTLETIWALARQL